MLPRALSAVMLAASASAENYVVYQSQTHTNTPPARALSASVIQHAVSSSATFGRYVWMFGGLGSSLNALNDLWRLDMQTNIWAEQTAIGVAPTSRRGATLALSEQRTAYLFGGETASRVKLNDIQRLDIGGGTSAAPTWVDITSNATGAFPVARTEHTATVATLALTGSPLGMLVFGGSSSSGVALADLHLFRFDTMVWGPLVPSGVAPQARKGHTATLLLNSLLAVFGGSNQDIPVFFADVHIYDISRNHWIQPVLASPSPAPDGREGHSMVEIGGLVYIFGGVNARGEKLADLWSFNVMAAVSGQLRWSQPVSMSSPPSPRWGHVGLASLGAMNIIGGTASDDTLLTDAWLMSTGCSGDLTMTSSRGVFSDGDGAYRNGLDCRWKIEPAMANTNVRVVITQLGLVDQADRLEIYDGADLTAPLLATYTGSAIPPSVTGSRSQLYVRLTTDAAGDNGDGFQAAYQAVCTAGYVWDTVSSSCTPCPAGSSAPFSASMSCTPCAIGFYATGPGSATCSQCPAYATTSATGAYLLEACKCQPGYFGWNNECRVCAEGASCPGGNLVSARAGWCETSNSTTAVPTFAHCCQPHLCEGGLNAMCDSSVGLVGEASCAVQEISWDTLHLVSLTTGTWVTVILILVLTFLICFCTGLSFGVRRAVRRQIDSLVVPVPANVATAKLEEQTPAAKTAVEPYQSGVEYSTYDAAPPPQQALPPDDRGVAPPPLPAPRAPGMDFYAPNSASVDYHSMLVGKPPGYGAFEGSPGGEEDVMEISLEDASAIGAGAPPPQLGGTSMFGRRASVDPMSEEAELEEETTATKKKKKKSKKVVESEEEGGGEEEETEEPEEEGKRKKKSKNGDNKKSRRKKGEEDGSVLESEEVAEEEAGAEKKKKKKKRREEE